MSGFSGLLNWLDAPLGDGSKVACFLEGGRYDGDRASVAPPAARVLYVTVCDGSCVVDAFKAGELARSCGMPTHWHDLEELDLRGDAMRNGAYYVLVATAPLPSGMRWALYWNAGHERPTRREIEGAQQDFERRFAAARAQHRPVLAQSTNPEGV